MKIRKVTLQDFMSHQHSVFHLPPSGIVLLTGANGAGKSSLIEGVAWCLWGKTVRGNNPAPCSVTVETDELIIHRSKSSSRAKLEISYLDGRQSTDFDTAAKAQEALSRIVGDMDIWQRTSVLSSADAAHFTLASDGDRKRMLESILNLGQFDEALIACRADVRSVDIRLQQISMSLQGLDARIDAANRRRQEHMSHLQQMPGGANGPNFAAQQSDLERLKNELAHEKALLAKFEEIATSCKQAELLDLSHAARYSTDALTLTTHCHTCKRPWDDDGARVARRIELATLIEGHNRSASAHRSAWETHTHRASASIKTIDQIKAAGYKLKAAIDAAKQSAALRNQLQEAVSAALDELDTLELEAEGIAASQRAAQDEAAELAACEKILGLRGVRSHVLSRALGGIEEIANDILAKMPPARGGLRIRLSSSKIKKTGGTSEVLDIGIEGAGGTDGYKGASGGERRRVDVALLFALMEVSGATFAKSGHSMFFDEVFDSLDVAGREAAIAALGELATDRLVVVISHDEHMVESIPTTAHLHIEDGKVRKI